MVRIFVAFVMTAMATAEWYQVIYLGIPMRAGAVLMTIAAAFWWLIVILRALRDE